MSVHLVLFDAPSEPLPHPQLHQPSTPTLRWVSSLPSSAETELILPQITSILAADLVHEFASIMVGADKKFAVAQRRKAVKDEL